MVKCQFVYKISSYFSLIVYKSGLAAVFCCCVNVAYEEIDLHLIFILNIFSFRAKISRDGHCGCMAGGTGINGGCQEQGSFLNTLQRTDAKFLL